MGSLAHTPSPKFPNTDPNAAIGFADAAHALAAHGVDVERVRRRYPPALRHDPTGGFRIIEGKWRDVGGRLDSDKRPDTLPFEYPGNGGFIIVHTSFFNTHTRNPPFPQAPTGPHDHDPFPNPVSRSETPGQSTPLGQGGVANLKQLYGCRPRGCWRAPTNDTPFQSKKKETEGG